MPSSTIEENVRVFDYSDALYIIRKFDTKHQEYYNELVTKKDYDPAERVVHDMTDKICFGRREHMTLLEYAFFIKNDLEVARLLKSTKLQSHDDIADKQWGWYWAVSVRRRSGLPLRGVNQSVAIEPSFRPAQRV